MPQPSSVRPSPSRSLAALALAAGTLASASPALAHPVRVDGDGSDWFARAPQQPNLAIVARDAASTGELIWLDASRDARNDIVSPETGADIQSLAITADATNLYFRVTLGADTSVVAFPIQIQIAIDVDRASGSGNTPFAGFAETDVAPEAAWERLVQTQGGLAGSVRVRDTAYAVVGMGAIATNATSHVTEISIPWSSLPPGRAYDVLRFSIATFRENGMGDTVEAGMNPLSDALDVMTDYGDPTVFAGVPTNTFMEVMDGVVNHSVDVWFGGTGREPYSPLQIVRFASDMPAPATEWLEVRNQTPGTLDLSLFAVGDEETPDGPESMMAFPAGATLAAGSVAVIAVSGSDFTTSYGVAPDYEMRSTAPGVPDLAPLAVWSTVVPPAAGTFGNLGDDLVALGFHHTMVDFVIYGTATYSGITPRTFGPGSSRVAVRSPTTRDTDNCQTDFPDTLDDCGPGAGACGTCRACVRFACAVSTGAACDDGDACTTGTTCSAAAVCGSGTAVSCDDSNGCTTDSCAPATGCVSTINAGALCDDGSACTSGDVCSAAGVCAGSPVTCNDMNPCTDDACAGAGCTFTPVAGRACSDGDPCTTGDACSAAGACVAGGPTVCTEDANPCTTAVCTATGCGFVNNTAACDDGDACTTGDVCGGGSCRGTARSCDDMNPCTADACAAGACTHAPTVGVACDDGDTCTSGDACTASGACAGTPSCDAGAAIDAAVSTPDAFLPGEDAGTMTGDDAAVGPDEDAGTMTGDDAGMTGDDAGMMVADDAGMMVAGDAGMMVGGDAGRRDAGALDAGPVMPPSNTGSCGCRAAGSGERAPLAALGALALVGLVVRRRRAR
jgi:MYXO-CTERM domain-containing protein